MTVWVLFIVAAAAVAGMFLVILKIESRLRDLEQLSERIVQLLVNVERNTQRSADVLYEGTAEAAELLKEYGMDEVPEPGG